MLGAWVLSFFLFLVVNGNEVHASEHHLQPYRTGFHFQPLKNWINGTCFPSTSYTL